jgi:hypothetical protein
VDGVGVMDEEEWGWSFILLENNTVNFAKYNLEFWG